MYALCSTESRIAEKKKKPRTCGNVESTYLEVSVDHEAVVHVFQAQDDLGGVEAHLLLAEHAVL